MITTLTPFVDWLTITFDFADRYKLDSFLEYLQFRMMLTFDFGVGKQADNYGGRWTRYSSAEGASIAICYLPDDMGIQARLMLPGDVLGQQVNYYLHRIAGEFRTRWGGRCTRIDIAVDDPMKRLNYDLIISAIRDKNIVGFQEGKIIESIGGKRPGSTVYCGARRSAKYGRFYNRGEVDRFEMEFKLDLADTIFIDYAMSEFPDSTAVLSSCLKGAISFVDKRSKNLSRNHVLPWWQNFMDAINGEPVHVPRKRLESSIDRTLGWINRSVSKAILKCRTAMGCDEFNTQLLVWVEEARNRVTAMDNLHVEQYQRCV
jgi:hypothetical protein